MYPFIYLGSLIVRRDFPIHSDLLSFEGVGGGVGGSVKGREVRCNQNLAFNSKDDVTTNTHSSLYEH